MKVRFVLLLFLIISCSVDTEDSKIEIDQSIFNNLITLETNESLTIDTSSYVIINYWASWCLECIEEHQYLIELSKTRGLTDKVILVSFQDSIENSIDFLNEYGRGDIIYAIDTESKLAIYSGVFGVPETHIILNNKIVKKYNLDIINENNITSNNSKTKFEESLKNINPTPSIMSPISKNINSNEPIKQEGKYNISL